MKKKKTLINIVLILTLLTPSVVKAEEYMLCGISKKIPTVIGTLVSTIYVIIRIIVPLLLVITGIIAFLKATFASNVDESLDKAKKKLITNIIAAAIIFFIVSITNTAIRLTAGKDNSFTNCLYCMLHTDECEKITSYELALCPGLLTEQDKYNPDCTLKDPNNPGPLINHSNTGDTKVPAYSDTIAKAGGGAIARTLRNNPDAQTSENITLKSYDKYIAYVKNGSLWTSYSEEITINQNIFISFDYIPFYAIYKGMN